MLDFCKISSLMKIKTQTVIICNDLNLSIDEDTNARVRCAKINTNRISLEILDPLIRAKLNWFINLCLVKYINFNFNQWEWAMVKVKIIQGRIKFETKNKISVDQKNRKILI